MRVKRLALFTFLGSRYYATGQSLSDGSVKPFRIAAFLLAAPAVAEDAKKQERFAIDVGSGFATYSSLIALSIDMQNWDSSDGVDEPADETHPELNYVVGSLGAELPRGQGARFGMQQG